ncbi:sigma-54-dependent transcriptional regulator [Deferrisoma camini]|uniref:sigma-54-dependent transcriptional regulator n=1 Tax=Deferrisoma camini TaxID=1035120 RepID=UPI00046CB8F6|nr:sigma-54 dependent transcriptional regulator [Deferrisoma camini]
MSDTPRILVVDDEQSMREFLAILLGREGYAVDTAADRAGAEHALATAPYDLVITDLKLPDGTGLDVLCAARRRAPDAQVVVITAFGTAESAVEAMKAGAYDYLTKPFKADEIRLTVAKALERTALVRENRELRRRLEAVEAGGEILGRSPRMQEVFRLLERVAPTGVTVLVQGESGTGKELVARRLHALSGRAGPFVAVNCAAIPEGLIESELFGHVKGAFTGAVADKPGLFEEATGGTLFLDEVGELPLHLQPKLLRALQEGRIKRVGGNREIPVDVRIVSATNRDLAEAVRQGRFREDLYYRLNVVALEIPPLRDRRADIPLLALHFLQKYAKAFGRPLKGFTREALDRLEAYSFPGNVRELENLVERAAALETGEFVGVESLPPALGAPRPEGLDGLPSLPDEGFHLEELLAAVERRYLEEALRRTHGNKTEAARLLGITFRSFRYRLERLGMR